jgi:hypothetical protein
MSSVSSVQSSSPSAKANTPCLLAGSGEHNPQPKEEGVIIHD